MTRPDVRGLLFGLAARPPARVDPDSLQWVTARADARTWNDGVGLESRKWSAVDGGVFAGSKAAVG